MWQDAAPTRGQQRPSRIAVSNAGARGLEPSACIPDGYIFTLSSWPIYWRSTLQSVIAMSTTEVEYMVASEVAKEAMWLDGLVRELGLN